MPRPAAPGNGNGRPTPEEAMDLVRGAPNKKQNLKRDLAKANNKYKNNPDKKDKRDKIEKDLKKDGHTQQEIDELSAEMYDEMAALGLLEPRNVD